MRWPTPQDFNEAIQNPKLCFSDPELAASVVATNALGLPQSISGNFASVYKLSSGATSYAVRCFLSNRKDQDARYKIIGDFLHQQPLRSSVPFQFLEKGIKVAGSWYPALKMPWIDGVSLDTYVQSNLLYPKKLTLLAQQFFEVVEEMESWQVAHGDLQHGNIIVGQDGLKLIDYDGFFVPGLIGFDSLEIGHPNYQHPLRTDKFFDDTVDNFSCWVIYVSLRCLAIDPSLFHRLEHSEECLIFRKADLVAPQESSIFRALFEHDSLEVRSLATAISRLLKWAPQTVPPLQVPDSGWSIESATILTACLELPKQSSELNQSSLESSQDQIERDPFVLPEVDSRINLVAADRPPRWGTSLSRSAFLSSSKVVRRLKSKIDSVVDRTASRMWFPLWAWNRMAKADKLLHSGDYLEAAEIYRTLHKLWNSADQNGLFLVLARLCFCYERTEQAGMASNFYRLASQLQPPDGKTRAVDFVTQKAMFFSFLASRRDEDRSSALSVLTEILTYHEQLYEPNRLKDSPFETSRQSIELSDVLDFADAAYELISNAPMGDVTLHTNVVLRLVITWRARQLNGQEPPHNAKLALERLLNYALKVQGPEATRDDELYLTVLLLLALVFSSNGDWSRLSLPVDRVLFERVTESVGSQIGWFDAVEAAALVLSSASLSDIERLAPALWRIVIRMLHKNDLTASLRWISSHRELIAATLDDKAKKGVILSVIHAFPHKLDAVGDTLEVCAKLDEPGRNIIEAVLNHCAEKMIEGHYNLGTYLKVLEWMSMYSVPVTRWDDFYNKYTEVQMIPTVMRSSKKA